MTNEQRVDLLNLVAESEGIEDFWLDRYDEHYRYLHNTTIISSDTGEVFRVALDEYDNVINRYPLSGDILRRIDDALIHESRELIAKIQLKLDEVTGR